MSSRVSASLVAACGLEKELVATSLDDYKFKITQFIQNPSMLAHIRDRLEQAREICPAFDTVRWMKNYEIILQSLWTDYSNCNQIFE